MTTTICSQCDSPATHDVVIARESHQPNPHWLCSLGPNAEHPAHSASEYGVTVHCPGWQNPTEQHDQLCDEHAADLHDDIATGALLDITIVTDRPLA